MLKNAKAMSTYIFGKLNDLKTRLSSVIHEVRGMGLMIGIELNMPGKSVVEECLAQGLIINCTQEKVLRLMPALNVTKKQADKAIKILEKALEKVSREK